jgi:hypothetical protein
VLGVADQAGRGDDGGERALVLDEWQRAQVVAVEIE